MAESTDKSPDNETIVVAVLCRPDEIIRAEWRIFQQDYSIIVVLPWTTGAIGMVGLTAALYVHLFGLEKINPSLNGVSPSPSDLLAFSLVCICPFIASLLLKKICKDRVCNPARPSKLNVLPGFCTVGKDGFQYQNSGFTGLFPWSELSKCLEYPDSLIVAIGRLTILIPKRCFRSNTELEAVRRLILKNKVAYRKLGKADHAVICSEPDIVSIKVSDHNPFESINQEEQPFEQKHPDSLLLSEPLMRKLPGQIFEFECAYDLNELRRINQKLFLTRAVPIIGIVSIFLTMIFMALPAALFYFFNEPVSANIVHLYAANFWWFYPLYTIRLGYSFYKKQDKVLQNLVNLDQPFLMELGEESIRIKGRRSILTYAWADFIACEHTADYFICHLKHGNILLPKRAFADRIKMAFVENLLHQKIANHSKTS